MAALKVRIFKAGGVEPETTVRIPVGVLKIAAKLIPCKAMTALQAEGIDLEEIVRLAENPEASGTLIEIENHKDNEKIVISMDQSLKEVKHGR